MRSSIAILVGLTCASCCLPFDLDDPPPPPAAAEPIPQQPVPQVPVAPPGRVSSLALRAIEAGPLPQAPRAGALFDGAAPHEGPIARGLLVCRAELLGGGYDDSFFAGGADIALATRLRNGAVRTTPQSPERVYTFPVSRLAPGDAVWVRVLDMDVLFHDTVAEGAASFSRTPFRLTMGQANVECRVVGGEVVARPARAALASMSVAIDELERAEPDVAADGLGYPQDRAQAVFAAARDALAWIEPSDREYAAQLARADGFDAEWSRRAVAAVHVAEQSLPGPGGRAQLGPGRRIRVARRACGEQANALAEEIGTSIHGSADGCLAVLELEATRATSIPPIDQVRHPEVVAIDHEARTHDVYAIARRRGGAWVPAAETITIAPGERVEIVIALGQADASLLRIRDGGEPILMRVR